MSRYITLYVNSLHKEDKAATIFDKMFKVSFRGFLGSFTGPSIPLEKNLNILSKRNFSCFILHKLGPVNEPRNSNSNWVLKLNLQFIWLFKNLSFLLLSSVKKKKEIRFKLYLIWSPSLLHPFSAIIFSNRSIFIYINKAVSGPRSVFKTCSTRKHLRYRAWGFLPHGV